MAPIWIIPALTYLCTVQGQSPCKTPDRKHGDCRNISECTSIMTIASKASKTQEDLNFLTNSICGFDGTNAKVCCPTIAEQSPSVAKPCFTPEGNQGQCISVTNCEHIAKRLHSPTVTAEDRAYVNSIRCQTRTPGFNVCCGPPPGSQPATGTCPDSECCGVDGSGGEDKIIGGTATAIDQYPWLAVIEYKKDNDIQLLCGGVLISARYVLTAGHCVKGPVLNAGTPTNVRLGEYDTSNYGPDCVPVAGGESEDKDCTDGAVSIPIERIIPYPAYDPELKKDDIAMLRLSELAPYTDFIRPICLPTRDVTTNMPSTARLIAAGWGANDNHSRTKAKHHVKLPYMASEACQAAYNVPGRRTTIYSSHICAGGERGQDSCRGDSGGPLMYSDGATFEVVGIVSFGVFPCGQANVPGVYTKVYPYMHWIKSTMYP